MTLLVPIEREVIYVIPNRYFKEHFVCVYYIHLCISNPNLVETRISLLVHGSWSEWEEWSECPATCGQGTQTRIRHCNSPAPEYGGDDCDVKGSTNSDSKNCNRPACTSMF